MASTEQPKPDDGAADALASKTFFLTILGVAVYVAAVVFFIR
jgi:hypothetical protein